MAESKKGEGALSSKHAEIFLKTPLFRFRYKMGNEETLLMENAVRVSGTIVDEVPAGVVVKVSVISNMKQSEEELPFDKIFIPFDKVDFIVIG